MSCYQNIATYYDRLMESGYYDHNQLAERARSAMGGRTSVLELGVGTGQMAKALLALDPDYDFCGIDFSAAMLEIARKRFSDRIPLVECDIANMDLDREFEVALSSGGTWVIVQSGNELLLGTHLFDYEKDLQGLQKTAAHLVSGGIVMLSVHPPHTSRTLDLALVA